MTTVRIVYSSRTLLASSEVRRDAVTVALAKRMGVGLDEPKVHLAIAVWWAIIIVAVGDWGPDTDWQEWTADMVSLASKRRLRSSANSLQGFGSPSRRCRGDREHHFRCWLCQRCVDPHRATPLATPSTRRKSAKDRRPQFSQIVYAVSFNAL